MKEDKFTKRQQQCLAVSNLYSVKPSKSFIPDHYNNWVELKKLRRIKYFTKALLELRAWGFNEGEGISCDNITAAVEKLILWQKSLPTYK